MITEMLKAEATFASICPDPIFIIGSPRSGTSILAWSLAQHSKLWTSSESDFLFYLFGDNCVDLAFQAAKERPDQGWLYQQNVDRSEFLSFLGLGLNALFTSRSEQKRWIDQSPTYTYMVDTLAEMFPGAFFIHILRDGRSVVNSMIKSGFNEPWAADFRLACQTWRQAVETAMDFCARHPARCLTIRNESLVKNPREGFRSIFDFIQVAYEKEPIHFFIGNRINSSYRSASVQTSQKQNNPCAIWKEWSRDQKEVFLEEAGHTLLKHNLATKKEMRRLGCSEESLQKASLAKSKPTRIQGTVHDLRATLEEITAWAKLQDITVAERDQAILELQAQVEECTQWGKRASEAVARRDEIISQLQKKVEEYAEWGKRASEEVAQRDATILSLQAQIAEIQTSAAVASKKSIFFSDNHIDVS